MCKCRKFMSANDLTDFINTHGIEQNMIVSIVYNPNSFSYVLIYFT